MVRWSLHKKNLFVGSSIAIVFVIVIVLTLYVLVLNNKVTIPSFFPEKEIEQKESISCANFKQDAPHIVESINLNKKWALLGSEFKSEDKVIEVSGELSELVNKYINEENPLKITYSLKNVDQKYTGEFSSDNEKYDVKVNYEQIKPDKYDSTITFETKCGLIEKDIPEIIITYPVYVAWTLDYEGYDVSDQYLQEIADLSNRYQVPLTHFYNPRIYTNPAISNNRQDYLTNWVKKRREQNHDAIELHIHMFPDLISAAGVTVHPNTQTWGSGNADGHNVLVTSYNYEEMSKILKWSKQVFAEKGLPTPTIFRAGGWFANSETLRAVEDTGFVADSSGRNKSTVLGGSVFVPWDLEFTAQPFHPNTTNQNSADSPNMKLWEFQNNGGDSWAYSADDMINRLQLNYNPDKAVTQRTIVTYITHPEWYYVDKPKMEKVIAYANSFQYKDSKGPIIFINLEDAYNIWNTGK